jgi:hypothetical protein
MLAGDMAVVDRPDRAAVIVLDAAAFLHPAGTGPLEALFDIDRRVGIGIDTGRIIDPHRFLARAFRERNFAQRHAQVGRRFRHRINFPRTGNRTGRDLRRSEFGFGERLVHRTVPFGRSGLRRGFGAAFAFKFPSLRRHDPDQVQRVFLSPVPGHPSEHT